MSQFMTETLQQLLTQSPILLVYLAGVVLALVNWQRYPSPARFTFVASVVLLVVSVAQSFVFHYLLFERVERGWTTAKVGVLLAGLGLITSLLHAAGLGLLLAGIFAGRKTAIQGDPPPLPSTR
ncbi:MAG: hypothetical protein ABSH47_01625 [Bryobacteraceae bacterium]|jgi:hypothetical protein